MTINYQALGTRIKTIRKKKGIAYVKTHPKSEFSATHSRNIFMEGLVGKAPCGLNTRSGKRIMVKVKWKDFKHFV